MTRLEESGEMLRLEGMTARELPPGLRLDADEEATRAAFLAWAADLEQQAGHWDHPAFAAALAARLAGSPSALRVTPSGRHVRAAGFRQVRGRVIALAAGSLGIALAIALAWKLHDRRVPQEIPFGASSPLAAVAPAVGERVLEAAAERAGGRVAAGSVGHAAAPGGFAAADGVATSEPATASEEARAAVADPSGQAVEAARIPAWEDTLDAELWWAREVLRHWATAPSRVDGRLAWMENRLAQLQRELASDSL